MSKEVAIPIIFGITGHRDLIEDDIPKLKDSVRGIFREFEGRYPNSRLILISALAEGADMLVADVALELGVELHILIPYDEDAYMQSFDELSNIDRYKSLKQQAIRFSVNANIDECDTTTCYQLLGEEIANRANVLIALWDGVDNGKRGGTSAIVNYQERGFSENRFDKEYGKILYIIPTPRKQNPIKSDFKIQIRPKEKKEQEKIFNIFKQIDKKNSKIATSGLIDGSYLKTIRDKLDNTADRNRDRFKLLNMVILACMAFAILSLEISDAFNIEVAILFYGVLLQLAFFIYFVGMKRFNVQNEFVHSRALSEAIRVQNVLNHTKINKCVSKYYLKGENEKFAWIVVALKNICYLDNKPFSLRENDNGSAKDWIDGQISYYKGALNVRENKLINYEFLEKMLYSFGLLSLILMFIVFVIDYFHIIDINQFRGTNIETILQNLHLLKEKNGELELNYHILLFASSVLLLFAAFIGEKFLKIEGYEDDIYRFNYMLNNFLKAQKEINKAKEDTPEYKDIVLDLAIKALEENSKWVVLHDSVRAKPSLE